MNALAHRLVLAGLLVPLATLAPPHTSASRMHLIALGVNGGDRAHGAAAVPGDSFSLDVAGLLSVLDALPEDERAEQIADWAVYGALLQANLSADAIRSATYDKAPSRLPGLSDVVNLDYGRGRRVILSSGVVWLLHDRNDTARTATIARLADVVRMELGVAPAVFGVFSYRPDLRSGAIRMRREPDVAREALFSSRYGYVERRVRSLSEFAEWLSLVDDVTHVRLLDNAVVEVGGRRHPTARTAGITLEDVATLYQAHLTIRDSSRRGEELILEAAAPVGTAFDSLVDAFNQNVRFANLTGSSVTGGEVFSRHVSRLRAALSGDAYRGSPAEAAAANFLLASHYTTLDQQRTAVEALRSPVLARMRALAVARRTELRRGGFDFAEEPGFSLDPRWDVQGVRSDLRLLLDAPADLVRRAQIVAASAPYAGATMPVEVRGALEVEDAFADMPLDGYRVPAPWLPALRSLIQSTDSARSRDSDEDLRPAFERLKRRLEQDGSAEASRLQALLMLIEFQRRFQCARYDGPLEGTHVGMVLFYTDLLAKIWAWLDYGDSAPVDGISGFLTTPRIGRLIEPHYWDETWRLSSARLWFGPRRTGYAILPDERLLNLAPTASRVYAAGSDPVRPGVEEAPAEDTRQVLSWWDRHFATVADYEPQYHVQNQIMKWSVITGWLADQGRLAALRTVPVDRSHRFDRWYESNPSLRFRRDVRFRPVSQWPDGNECIEILSSYSFPLAGAPYATIRGGVSLGSARSLESGVRISRTVTSGLRRAGLDYGASTAHEIRTLSGTRFRLPAALSGRPVEAIVHAAQPTMRAGAVEVAAARLSSRVTAGGSSGSIRLAADGRGLGTLAFERSGPGVRLRWNAGSLELDRSLVHEAARVFQAEARDPAAALAARESFLPTADAYVVEGQAGVEVFIAPPPGRPISRALQIRPEGRTPVAGAYLRSSAAPEAWQELPRRAGTTRAAAVVSTRSAALRRLTEFRWQRLRPMGDGTDALPGRVERVFTNAGPNPTRPGVRVSIAGSGLGGLDAVVTDGAVYLRRPTTASLGATFDDFVVTQRVSSRQLSDLVAQARAGAPTPRLGSAPIERSAEVRAAFSELATAAPQQGLDQALAAFRERVRPLGLTGLSGQPSDVAQLFVRAGSPDADGLIFTALRSLAQRDLGATVRSLDGAARGAAPSAEAMRALGRQLAAAEDFVRARHGLIEGFSPQLAPRLTLEQAGYRLQTVLEVPPQANPQVLSLEQRRTLASASRARRPAEVYVEDTQLFNGLDWDQYPGPTLSHVAADPRVIWEQVLAKDLGSFRPGRWVEGAQSFVRRDLPHSPSAADREAQAAVGGRLAARRVIRIRACPDADRNGAIDRDEQAVCQGEGQRRAAPGQ